MVSIRRLSPDDWRLFRELRLSALAEAPYAYSSTLSDWQGERDSEARWRRRLSDVPYNAVAIVDASEVGIVSATAPNEDGETELISMWVAPCARGKGVGDALIRAVLKWAGTTDARNVFLLVREDNGAARVLYERNGFTLTNSAGEEADPPELRMTCRVAF